MTVGIGLIGCGRRMGSLGTRLKKHSDKIDFRALYDPAPTAVEWVKDNLNPDITVHSDYHELVKNPSVDWVLVGSWNRFHREHAIAAFEAGKHVFCEKPLANNIDDCLAMFDAWRASGCKFSMGFTLRYSPHYRAIRKLLDEGRVGRIISIEFNETLNFCHGGFIMGDWRRRREHAGSHLLEKCCHDIDLASWMLDSKAVRVSSFGGLDLFRPENAHLVDQVGPREDGKPAYQTWWHDNPPNPFTADKDIVDNQVAIVEYENGVRATFHTNCSSGIPERRMYICGSEGAIRADLYAGKIEYQKIGFDTVREEVDAGVKGGHGGGDEVLVESLVDCMVNDAEPFTGLEHGLIAAITSFAIDEAMDTGSIVDVRPYWRKAGLAGRGTIEWDFPLPRTHCGVMLGNGNFGLQVWGTDRLCLTVGRADFWDHRNGEVVPEGGSYDKVKQAMHAPDAGEQFVRIFNDPDNVPPWKSYRPPMGRFEFKLAEGITLQQAILDLDRGQLDIKALDAAGLRHTVSLALAPNESLAVIRDPDRILERARGRSAWEWPQSAEGLRLRDVPEAEAVSDGNLVGWIQPLPIDPSMAALCRKTKDGFRICCSRGDDNTAARRTGEALLSSIDADGTQSVFDRTADWWRDYWKDVPLVHLPAPFYNRFLDYALFKFGAATAPQSPIPSGLQGSWAEEYQMPPWSGDYHFNVNIQQIYTLAFAANKTDHLMPLFDMLEAEEFFGVMRQTARRLYGVDDGLVITHAVDDRGRQVGGMSVGSLCDQACGGWTAQLYWLYWKHTGDKVFLRDRAYPFIRGMMRAYEGMLEKREDGSYHVPISISAEYRYTDEHGRTVNYGADPSYQLACIHMLLDALFEACDVLEIEPRQEWRDIKAHLPLYTLVEDETDGPRIAVWKGQDLDECHRHHSHLGCIYPFDSLGEWTPDKMEVIDNSIDHWIGKGMGQWSEWCIPWAAIIQARRGLKEAPKLMLDLWKEVFINEGLNTVYLPRFRGLTAHRRDDLLKPKEANEVMQLDGTMGGATAIYEMLAHCRGGVIRVFPAVPDDWKDISFRGIGVPGPARVSAERKHGHTRSITIESAAGGTFALDCDDLKDGTISQGGEDTNVALPVTVVLTAGESVHLCPRS